MEIQLITKLGKSYDIDKLVKEYKVVEDAYNLIAHHSSRFEGSYGISLVAPKGDYNDLRIALNLNFFKTEVMKYTPYIESIIDSFGEPCGVRFLNMAPGGHIDWHVDTVMSADKDAGRFHIPIITNPQARFQVAKEVDYLDAGELYYTDTSFPHTVRNDGTETRTHLIIDIPTKVLDFSIFPSWWAGQKAKRTEYRKSCKIKRGADGILGLGI